MKTKHSYLRLQGKKKLELMVNRNGNSQYVTSRRIFTPTPVNRYLTFISGRGRATKGHRCKLSRSSRYEKTKWYVLTVKQDMFMEPTSETYSANVWVWSVYISTNFIRERIL